MDFLMKVNQVSFTGLVPRNLYHLTTEANYRKMLQDGFITPVQSDAAGANVFMVELNNLVTKWKNIVYNFFQGQQIQAIGNPDNVPIFFDSRKLVKKTGMPEILLQRLYPDNLVHALFAKTNPMCLDETVALKIPTKTLDIDSLFIRDQLTTNNFVCSKEYKNLLLAFRQHMEEVRQSLGKKICTKEEFDKIFSSEFEKFIPDEYKKLILGDTAKKSKLYKMRGRAIEYLYRKPIDVNQVEIAGKLDLNKALGSTMQTTNPYKTLLEMLFNGKGEKKAIEQL